MEENMQKLLHTVVKIPRNSCVCVQICRYMCEWVGRGVGRHMQDLLELKNIIYELVSTSKWTSRFSKPIQRRQTCSISYCGWICTRSQFELVFCNMVASDFTFRKIEIQGSESKHLQIYRLTFCKIEIECQLIFVSTINIYPRKIAD